MPVTDKLQNYTDQSDYKMCWFRFFKKAENRLVDTFLGSVSLSDFFFAIGLRSIYYFANVHENINYCLI